MSTGEATFGVDDVCDEAVRLAGPAHVRVGDRLSRLGEVTWTEAPATPRRWWRLGLRLPDGEDGVLAWPERQSIVVRRAGRG
jgi:hypothetical protein